MILPEFSHLGLAAATEPLFIANWLAQAARFEWNTVSIDGAPVRASNGMRIPVDGDLASAVGAKTVFVLASFEPDRASNERRVLKWLQKLGRFGVELCGIENGSLALARAGLLNGHEVAVHWDNMIGFAQHHPRTRPVERLYVRSAGRITCAGASAILDMMVAWIGWHGEPELAVEVAEHLLLSVRPADTGQRSSDPAASSAVGTAVARAQQIMHEHVDEPLSCGEIARRVGLSLRQIERRFKQELNCSILQKYRLIRMTRAHQLLQQTGLSVTEVALSCGFSSPEYFCRLYRAMFNCSPSADRRQATNAPVLRQRGGARR